MAYYAIVDGSGALVSEGSEIDHEDLSAKGLIAVEVDGPQDGRLWDRDKRCWVANPILAESVEGIAKRMFLSATSDTQRIVALAVFLRLIAPGDH